MITINLLPQEYRKKQRTPFKYMAAVAASVAVNASLVAWLGWTAFGVAAEVKSELSVLEDTEQGLAPQVAYHQSLEKESKLFQSRESTLARITQARVSWTKKVDQLVDLINRGGEEKYLVWLDDLNVDQKENKRAGSAGMLKAAGHSGSENFAHVANFIEDVEESEFALDFFKPAPPEGSQSSIDENLMPAAVWSFPLELALRAPEERSQIAAALRGEPVKPAKEAKKK